MTFVVPGADPRQPLPAPRALVRLPLRAALARAARLLAREDADGGDPARADVPAAVDHAVGLHLPALLASRAAALVAQILPATHFIAISRGIIIRGAGFVDLWQNVAALLAIAAVLVAGSTQAFRKTIS